MRKPLAEAQGVRVLVYRLLFVLVVLVSWEYSSGRYFDAFWFSRPTDIARAFWLEVQSGRLGTNLGVTLQETFLGFPIGAAAGMITGFLLGRWTTLAQVLDPIILGLYGVPRIALAPLFIIWFGIGPLSKIMLVVLMVFFLTFFNTYAGVRSVAPDLKNVARVMGANERQVLLKIVIPAASPWIFTGLKVSVPYSLVGAIVGEFMASSRGLGYAIMLHSNTFNTKGVFVGILIIMVIVIMLNGVLNKLEGYVLRWRPQEERRATPGY